MRLLIQYDSEWLSFHDPVEVLKAGTPDEVRICLEKIERSGLWAAGFISYEAAGAFDDALRTYPSEKLPLLCFGLFSSVEKGELPTSAATYQLGEWVPSGSRTEYAAAIAAIKDHIAAGDTYQVNYTFRLHADFSGDPFSFFCDLTSAQQGRYGAYVELEGIVICSASPELFFEYTNGVVTSRPMKGTRPRGLTVAADRAAAIQLRQSEKDRAENIMIVDMIRNDIGRVAVAGSVETVSRFDLEKYPTVWQMTSMVIGETRCGVYDILKNLFPCASITGAPKAKTMEIIRELETGPRGIYTGSIGFIAPDGTAQFNVAIRTAVVDRISETVEYGIGGGIVWDSNPEQEYQEALSKAVILTKKIPPFQLLETMLWEDGHIFLLERHLNRLANSADYFDFQIQLHVLQDRLNALRFDTSMRLRLVLNKDGTFEIQPVQMKCGKDPVPTVVTAKHPINSKDPFLYHKTTNRAVYEKAKADFPETDDVLLYNEKGQITESCIANIVVELDGRMITPMVDCGLLSGTFREELLANGTIEEGFVQLRDLERADSIYLINSIRKWRRVHWDSHAPLRA